MPVFMPNAPAGGNLWAASPARNTRLSCSNSTSCSTLVLGDTQLLHDEVQIVPAIHSVCARFTCCVVNMWLKTAVNILGILETVCRAWLHDSCTRSALDWSKLINVVNNSLQTIPSLEMPSFPATKANCRAIKWHPPIERAPVKTARHKERTWKLSATWALILQVLTVLMSTCILGRPAALRRMSTHLLTGKSATD